ncbi:hypothetical protein HK101_003945 [Irineochytrium annulatum]|nr:hypothetical protein HK101_003945 [Irineochytrium annulatum]
MYEEQQPYRESGQRHQHHHHQQQQNRPYQYASHQQPQQHDPHQYQQRQHHPQPEKENHGFDYEIQQQQSVDSMQEDESVDLGSDPTLEWLHCNRCWFFDHAVNRTQQHQQHRQEPRTFFVTQCGHVVCQLCMAEVTRGRVDSTLMNCPCPVCGANGAIVALAGELTTSEMPPEIERIISPAVALLEDGMKMLKFQMSNSVKLLRILKRKCDSQSRLLMQIKPSVEQTKAEINKYKEANKLLTHENELLKRELERVQSVLRNDSGPSGYYSPSNVNGRPIQTPQPPSRLSLRPSSRGSAGSAGSGANASLHGMGGAHRDAFQRSKSVDLSNYRGESPRSDLGGRMGGQPAAQDGRMRESSAPHQLSDLRPEFPKRQFSRPSPFGNASGNGAGRPSGAQGVGSRSSSFPSNQFQCAGSGGKPGRMGTPSVGNVRRATSEVPAGQYVGGARRTTTSAARPPMQHESVSGRPATTSISGGKAMNFSTQAEIEQVRRR